MNAQNHNRSWGFIAGSIVLFGLLIGLIALVFDIRFSYTMQIVALGGAVLGVVTGVLGSFAVLRQQSLMGDALSHAALPGVAIAFLLTGKSLGWLLLGAGIAGWLAVLFIYAVTRTTRLKQDTLLGVTLTSFFAIGIALLAYIQSRPDASQAGLDRFIFGQAAAIVRSDVLTISGVGLVSFAILALLWKEFKVITFDPEFAQANGFPARLLDMLLSTMVVVAVVLGLQIAGVILMVGMLIAPGVAARQWTANLGQMIVLAAIFGGFSGAAGAIVSGADAGLATGPLIIVAAFLIVFVSILLAPDRGMVWRWSQNRQDRRRFAALNVLRDMRRYALGHGGDPYHATPEAFLRGLRGNVARTGLRQLESSGLIRATDKGWVLMPEGLQRAEADEHNQELWQLYRLHADELRLPIISEDRQKDITKILPADAISRLKTLTEGA